MDFEQFHLGCLAHASYLLEVGALNSPSTSRLPE